MAVRPETDSKSPAPRPAAPQGELEQYGVWVKAEPQDIAEEPVVDLEEDFSLPEEALGASPGEEESAAASPDADLGDSSFLTEEEERLLGSFEELGDEEVEDFELGEPAPARSAARPAPSPATEEPAPFSGMEELPPLEDFSISDLDIAERPAAATAPGNRPSADLESFDIEIDNEPVEDFAASTIDISLEELESAVEQPGINANSALDMDDIEGLGSPVAKAEGPRPSPSPAAEAGDLSMEDVSAEFLDFSDEPGAKAAGAASEPSDVTEEFFDAEPSAAAPAPAEVEFEPIDIDLHFEDTIPASSRDGSSSEAGFEEVSEFDNFLAEEAPAKAAAAAPEPGFDDLAALERDLATESEPAKAPARTAPQAETPAQASANAALSNEILLKIAAELSSIRGELVNLKSQLGALQQEATAPVAAHAEESADEGEAAPSGFFDEEEDETIALTGDELDNILNTADFTEETPVEPVLGADEAEISLHEEELGLESLLPESGDYSVHAEEAPIEEIRLEPVAEEPAPLAASEADEVKTLIAEGGVLPMTSAPEDTSYLEEPLAAEEMLDLGESPLAEAPLIEPDLSEINLESEEFEELLEIPEISEELPVIEGQAEEEPKVDALADLTLDIEAGSDYSAEPSHEAEELAPLPEFEDASLSSSSFEEISLAHEGAPEPLEEELAVEELAAVAEEPFAAGEEAFSMHPDELPTSLDDSFFVGTPAPQAKAAPAEELAEDDFSFEEIPAVEAEEVPASELAAEEPFEATLESDFAESLEEAGPEPESDFVATLGEEELVPTFSIPSEETAKPAIEPLEEAAAPVSAGSDRLKGEIRSVLSYLDKLLESLPEDKIEEFARSEYFDTYKKLFEELGLV